MNNSTEFPNADSQSQDAPQAVPLIDAASQDAIGEKLRDAFADVLHEPTPQRFIDLTDNLSKESL